MILFWIALIIIFILVVLILIPKATKPYADKANWGKGFYRLYVIFSTFLSICVGFVFYDEYELATGIIIGFILWVALILFGNFIGWLFKGFKK
jgi:lipopolysaccharide export LptBFGC system permease protein LptF